MVDNIKTSVHCQKHRTSELAFCNDCDWVSEDVPSGSRKAAYKHAERTGHTTSAQVAVSYHYTG